MALVHRISWPPGPAALAEALQQGLPGQAVELGGVDLT